MKSKILLNRSASVKADSIGDCGPEVENVDSGSDKVTVGERTLFINAGSAVDDASAAVNQVEIGIDGVVTVVNTIAVGDVVVAEVVVANGVIVECGGYYMC